MIGSTARYGWLVASLALAATWPVVTAAQSPQALLNRAIDEFENGRFDDSASTFDRVVEAAPSQAPYLWQRGIALYYAKRYIDCQRQFESHRTVNGADVENAAWHFLCVARA
jgi:lipoprotein NlpI